MRVLVTGGAGYIGAHVVRLLQQRGDHVVVADDLVTGDAERLGGVSLERIDLSSDGARARLESLMREHQVEAVIHFAARKQVAESVARPAWYFQQNVGALANVLQAMENMGVEPLVFSSSAAVYGAAQGGAISETDPTDPINPYGETKLVSERLIAASSRAFTLKAASLRYFNVAGAGWDDLGDRAVLNLVPMVFERLSSGLRPMIFGADYPTPDGTCVRDYVHVLDLAEAHIAALVHLVGADAGHVVLNVGTGVGTSVRTMVESIMRVSGTSLEPQIVARRAGDPAAVVASPHRISDLLGWRARFGLEEIVSSAWEAWSVR